VGVVPKIGYVVVDNIMTTIATNFSFDFWLATMGDNIDLSGIVGSETSFPFFSFFFGRKAVVKFTEGTIHVIQTTVAQPKIWYCKITISRFLGNSATFGTTNLYFLTHVFPPDNVKEQLDITPSSFFVNNKTPLVEGRVSVAGLD